jgi:tRNA A-37 threonylcarbamoyl transferase component Bud32
MDMPIRDEQLWEWLDDASPQLAEHLASHPDDQARVERLRQVLEGVRAALAPPQPERTPPRRVGRFRLVRPIGRGGMGVVYEAEQEAPRRRVAVKLLRDAAFDDDSVRERLAREADALGRLAHPHIATVFEHGVSEDGEPYLALEFVEGVAADLWARERRARTREIVALLEKVARAVHHAHGRGIVHRDLKPANVLVDERGEPKVLDFGLAHLATTLDPVSRAATLSGRIFGTLAYMSPEQARGESRGDPRSDVYALGAMAFELLCGSSPYDLSARSVPEALRIVAEGPRQRLSKADARLAGDLDAIVGKALECDRERRYASAEEFADDLRRHLDGAPVRARPPSLVERMRRAVRRHAVAIAVGSALVALGGFGLYAALLRVDLGPLHAIGGDWYAETSPFDGVRWEGDTPIVKLGETWYELVKIEGLSAAYVIGFCRQHGGDDWRRRFRDDLLEVLNRMGRWPLRSVELVLKDLESGALHVEAEAPLDHARRRAGLQLARQWYVEGWDWTPGGARILHEGRWWELESFDGVGAAELAQAQVRMPPQPPGWRGFGDLDSVFHSAAGRSPLERVSIVLREPGNGETRVFHDVERRVGYRASALGAGVAPLPFVLPGVTESRR